MRSKYPIVIFGDLHFPWHHQALLKKAIKLCGELKPGVVIQIGDLYDMFAQARFAKPRVLTPGDEIISARKLSEKFWRDITRVCPDARKYQLRGNHDERPKRVMLEKVPELEPFFDLDSLWEFPDVTTLPSEREGLILNDIMFCHGYLNQIGDHCKQTLTPVVHGHTHKGGAYFLPTAGGIWELDVGYLADDESPALSYTRLRQCKKWNHGIGLVDKHGPRFIPLSL